MVLRLLLTGLLLLGLVGCSDTRHYTGPEVTRVVIFKDARKMQLFHHDKVIQTFDVGLGFRPKGHKLYEGDGRTPEGVYFVNKRNPNSRYHLSIGISYPNARDVQVARGLGLSPGGDIFIHGRGPEVKRDAPRDWTAGCVAVKDHEIETIYAMVKDGTPIQIMP